MVDDFYKYKKKEGTWIREVIPQSHTWMGFVICLVLSREGGYGGTCLNQQYVS
jgi:hypothetical protein